VLSTLLGAWEIIVPLLIAAFIAVLVVALIGVLDQPNMNDQQIEKAMNDFVEEWGRYGLMLHIVLSIVWTFLTACFFIMLRNRYEPDWALEQPAA
jgi:hypothetical protein